MNVLKKKSKSLIAWTNVYLHVSEGFCGLPTNITSYIRFAQIALATPAREAE